MRVICWSLGALLASAGSLSAGPLAPPVGPVSPTLKTLNEVEPSTPVNATNTPGDDDAVFVISQPGPYHLTADVAGQAGKDGIQILADGVTLDLRGFSVRGVPGSLRGIADQDPDDFQSRRDIRVLNGSITDWGDVGLSLGATARARVESVNVESSSATGIFTGRESVVVGCTSTDNSFSGFILGEASVAIGCSSSFNGSRGFSTGQTCSVQNCAAYDNDSEGFSAGNGTVLTGCTSYRDQGGGFSSSGASALGCVVRDCGDDGFAGLAVKGCRVLNPERWAYNCSHIIDCTASGGEVGAYQAQFVSGSSFNGCDVGIWAVFDGAVIQECRVSSTVGDAILVANKGRISGCLISNAGEEGIQGGDGLEISNCVVDGAGARGIFANDGANIWNCTVRNSVANAIQARTSCRIAQCVIEDIGGAGISVQNVADIRECVVKSTTLDGIFAGETSLVSGCTLNNCAQAGIVVTFQSTVVGNRLDFITPGVATDSAILATGSRNRIDGNSISRCDWGISTGAGGNVIINNSVSTASQGPFNVMGTNVMGPWLDFNGIFNTPHPQANFTH